MDFIYCRGGDKSAPKLAQQAGMLYGLRYDYTAYSDDVYMLDAGLNPRWAHYKNRVKQLRPTFALVPDFEVYRDALQIELYIQDLRVLYVPLIGVAPKFYGALEKIPIADDIVICVSMPSTYSGYLPTNEELRPANYHLLGGDVWAQVNEAHRIQNHGGVVISADGNKLAMKAAHGQYFDGQKWVATDDTTENNALKSAINIMSVMTAENF